MKDQYDVIVVGAGPAGSTAARFAAAGGASVLLLEKDRDVGYPVRCAEAVSHEGVVQFIEPDPRWIAATVSKFRIVVPNGNSIMPRLDGIGYVLERRIFDYELAKLAVKEGAEVITKAYVYDLIKEDGDVTGVRVLIKDRKFDIRAKVVIGADGVESRVGKWAGIDTTCHIHDMESCAQVTLSGVAVDEGILDFYFGDQIAPGGYLWVFPKGKDSANVGIGISVECAKEKAAVRWLDEFVQKKFPDAAMLTQIAGGVPCAKTCDEIVKGNVLLVGDAAHQVNPTSGGGIISGMIGGMIAGQVAGEAIAKKDSSHLIEYGKRWHKRLGWRHEVFYRIREAITSFSDETLNKLCDSAVKLPEEKRTVGGLFRTAMWNQPSILLDIAKVFIS
ncbi:MAG: Dehydrogenase flavoprotein [Bacteroidetes bacterium]|jgi:digeranylgeranylglycerophospholipid reductase|nr:Dehydrogenase flavoprotein [Bacteroidota bacterium]